MKWLSSDEGACMVARTEPGGDGVCRPVIPTTRMRAVANDGDGAASLVTRGDFQCAQFARR